MKLIIISIIMGITIPTVFAGLNYYQEKQMKLDLEMEVDRIISKINSVSRMHEGSKRTMEISLPSRFMAKWKYIKIGDSLPIDTNSSGGEFSKRIRYKVEGSSMKTKDVGKLVTNKDSNGPLVLEDREHFRLELSRLKVNNVVFVRIEDITYS